MRRTLQPLTWLYARALSLYPRLYRAEYGEEMLWVFERTVEEADGRGALILIRLGLRELWHLPGAILREYQRLGRKRTMIGEKPSPWTLEAGSRREALAALAPFLLLGVLPALLQFLSLSGVLSTELRGALVLALLGVVLALSIIGVVTGLPRWVLPYGGAVLSIASVYLTGDFVLRRHWVAVSQRSPWFVRQVAYQGQLWAGILVLPLIFVLLAGLLRPLRPLYRRVRQDWTLASFSVYGSALLALLLTFDDYAYDEPYRIAAVAILSTGASLYLRSGRTWQRALSLFAGLTLAMAVAAAGKAILYASANWPGRRLFTWQTEAMSTVIMWGWLVIALFVPALLGLLSQFRRQRSPALACPRRGRQRPR